MTINTDEKMKSVILPKIPSEYFDVLHKIIHENNVEFLGKDFEYEQKLKLMFEVEKDNREEDIFRRNVEAYFDDR